ncbi:guanylate cyclase domain-containing protein [Haematococcus lacustris]|uniref:Guanylate cyclase domain-containing protein n=1 Tax=Haematococcus lacustris TaxID=44745 RepID=A0A6A0A7A4_HAELA|nr:guanylate cyclase domain-containing protein [Haematococcus lacustris]
MSVAATFAYCRHWRWIGAVILASVLPCFSALRTTTGPNPACVAELAQANCSEPEKLLANLVALQCPLVNFDLTLRLGAVSATLLAAAFPAANASVSQAWSAQATVLNASLSAVQLSQQQSASLSQRQDVYLVPSDYIPGFVSTKLIGSLEDVYQAQDDIAATTAADGTPMDSAWFSIDRVFREPSVLYNQIWGMPLGGSVTYLAYRPDVLSGLQLDPSLLASWEGLLQLVESDALRTLDMNGDGQPDFPFCFPRAQGETRMV